MSALPLLLLCGIGSDADSWRDQVEALGGQAIVAEGDTVDAMAAHVLTTAPPRFALAGHSMGGYVALAAMAMAPDRIARLALVNSSAAPDTEDQRANRIRTIAGIEAKGLGPLMTHLPRLLSDDPQVQERVGAMLLRAGATRVLREQRACAARPDRRTALEAISIPTCIIGAEDDAIVPVAASCEMARLMPRAQLAILNGGGHASPMARPTEVTALLYRWLEADTAPQ